ncbi:hypothetical protein [Campylobacter armoricus]|nr:hypothetical protein [Campylobacter armoricus]
MNKKKINNNYINYEKLLYINFPNLLNEDEILIKSFKELGIKDDFSYKLAYFYNEQHTHVFLTKFENILDYDVLIPEPLLFEAYFNQKISKNLVLIFKNKYIVLVEYLGNQFQNCKTIPNSIYNINYEQQLKNNYENILSVNDVKSISGFKKNDSNILYFELLQSNINFKINFALKEEKLIYKTLSFKILSSFIFGVLFALIYPLYLYFHGLTIENEIERYENILVEEEATLKHFKQKQKQTLNLINMQNENNEKNQYLYDFYKNTLCYKDFYNFIKILNIHKSLIEKLIFKDNVFQIELTKDYNFYDDFKKYGFILKNKEINNEKINIYLQKNI